MHHHTFRMMPLYYIIQSSILLWPLTDNVSKLVIVQRPAEKTCIQAFTLFLFWHLAPTKRISTDQLRPQHGNMLDYSSGLPQQINNISQEVLKEHCKESERFITFILHRQQSDGTWWHLWKLKQRCTTHRAQKNLLTSQYQSGHPQMFFVKTVSGQSSSEGKSRTCSSLSG